MRRVACKLPQGTYSRTVGLLVVTREKDKLVILSVRTSPPVEQLLVDCTVDSLWVQELRKNQKTALCSLLDFLNCIPRFTGQE